MDVARRDADDGRQDPRNNARDVHNGGRPLPAWRTAGSSTWRKKAATARAVSAGRMRATPRRQARSTPGGLGDRHGEQPAFDESIQGMRLQVMRRAATIGVSAACREAGISRTLFYRWQHRLSRYGVDGLHPRRVRARPGPGPQLAPHVEGHRSVLPKWFPCRDSHSGKDRQMTLSSSRRKCQH